jgi:hypothetical protein
VLNGGDGAWKQPQPFILFLLYADVIDAVLTLDGFNESHMLAAGTRFEYPATANFLSVNPLATQSYSGVVARWIMGNVAGTLQANAVFGRSHATYLLVEGLEAWFQRSGSISTQPQKTTIESIFALPSSWDQQKRFASAINQYQKYIRATSTIAAERGILVAHFIQPVPAIGKTLTQEEKAVVGDLSYRSSYERMTDDLLSLRKQRIKIFSLLDLFASETGALYADAIHVRFDGANGDSRGYRLMAERIATILGEAWDLTPKGRVRRDG